MRKNDYVYNQFHELAKFFRNKLVCVGYFIDR